MKNTINLYIFYPIFMNNHNKDYNNSNIDNKYNQYSDDYGANYNNVYLNNNNYSNYTRNSIQNNSKKEENDYFYLKRMGFKVKTYFDGEKRCFAPRRH